MKIVEYSKGSITEVENVFKVVESGAQGPQGPAGTIGTLDLLDPKVTPVDADLMLVGDSAASFANKKTTWANVKATLKAFFDVIYQPLSTALSKITEAGGLPLWDGGAWPGGGGGGGPLTLISATTVVPADAVVEFGFTVDKTKIYRMKITHMDFYIASPFQFEGSIDGGSTYLTSVCDSLTVWSNTTAGTATAQADRVHLANAGRMGSQIGGTTAEVELELFWHNGGWILTFVAGALRDTTYLRHANGHGSIQDATGAVNFINFVTTVSGIETAKIYWYEVNYDF